jgi:hypothetical protein
LSGEGALYTPSEEVFEEESLEELEEGLESKETLDNSHITSLPPSSESTAPRVSSR